MLYDLGMVVYWRYVRHGGGSSTCACGPSWHPIWSGACTDQYIIVMSVDPHDPSETSKGIPCLECGLALC